MGIELMNKLCDAVGTEADFELLTFDQIVTRLATLIDPQPLEIYERYRFHSKVQAPNESVQDVMDELNKIAIHCNFEADAAAPKKARLRDQFICALVDAEMRKWLLQQADLTVDNVVARAKQFESIVKKADLLGPSSSRKSLEVDAVKSGKATEKKPQSGSASGTSHRRKCTHCGKVVHSEAVCWDKHPCNKCHKKGHWEKYCPLNKGKKKKTVGQVDEEVDDDEEASGSDVDHIELVGKVSEKEHVTAPKLLVDLWVNRKKKTFQMDTGSGATFINRKMWNDLGSPLLTKPKIKFVSYSGHELPVLGQLNVAVGFQKKTFRNMALFVVDGNQSPLMGRRWCKRLKMSFEQCYEASSDWDAVNQVNLVSELDEGVKKLVGEYQDLFNGELGSIKGIEASLTRKTVTDGIRKFWPARPVPYAVEERVNMELDRLEQTGILERVPNDVSEVASPIVVVAKRGTDAVRICGDFKVAINKMIEVEQYPLPKAEDLFAKIGEGKIFTTLDLSEAYHQVKLDEEASKLLVINTKKGLYRYRRLPFGVASAPAIFQRIMDTVLKGIPGVSKYLDDVLISAKNVKEHLERLRQVFDRFRQYGIRLNLRKCLFAKSAVQFLGHEIDGDGLHATESKMEAIKLAPQPKNVSELRSFLGLVTYYGKFIENQSTICAPLNDLLKKGQKFEWGKAQAEAFEKLKKVLASPPVLCHYDPKLPIGLATDASQSGVGAVLFHLLPDGSEKPIAYGSSTLSSSQRNYSQIEKEAYSIIFGITKFKSFLYGRRFTLVTDHKPLLALFGEEKPIPDRASSRLQRWALQLMGFTYDLKFKTTDKHANADSLSRLPLKTTSEAILEDIFFTDAEEFRPCELSNSKLVEKLKQDSTL